METELTELRQQPPAATNVELTKMDSLNFDPNSIGEYNDYGVDPQTIRPSTSGDQENAKLLVSNNSLEDVSFHLEDEKIDPVVGIEAVDVSTLRRTPLWNVVVNSVTYMAAPMAMPATMAQAGWAWGTGLLVYSAGITYMTGLLLGEICLENQHLDTYPKVAEEAIVRLNGQTNVQPVDEELPPGAKTPIQAQAVNWPRLAFWSTLVLQFIAYYLDTVAQIIYVEQYFGELLPHSKICQWQWLLVTWLVSVPVMQIPTLHASRHISLLAFALVIINVVCIGVEVFMVQPWNCVPGPSFPPTSPGRVFVAAASMAYAFGGHGMYPEEFREMKDPKQWPQVMNWTYGVIVPMYIFASFLGYAAYGGYSKANLNINYPDNWVNLMSLLLQLPACLYLIYFTNLILVLQVELALGVDPTKFWEKPWGFLGLPPAVLRFLFRTAFVGSQVLLGELLLSGEGDTILGLQSLAGSLGMSVFTYILPFVFHAIFFWDRMGSWTLAFYAFNILIGTVFMVGGVYSSIDDLLQGSTGFFNGECQLKYTYAPESPDDPCYLSGI